MSTQASRSAKLLHADEEQIDRASIQIGDGTAFVVFVCPEDARAAALSRLRGRLKGLALPDPVELGTAEEVLSALEEQAGQRDRVLSIVLGRDLAGALDALNLHREKLLAGGPVLVWLDDVDALRVLRERAPDAYSFRNTLVLVKGDGGALPLPSAEEPEAVVVARKRLRRARMPLDKAAAGQDLAQELLSAGRLEQAAEAARTALLALPAVASEEDREERAWLCRTLASISDFAGKIWEEMYWYQRAQAEFAEAPLARELEVRVQILSALPGPYLGHDRKAVNDALDLVRRYGLAPDEQVVALRAAAEVAIAQGDLRRARKLFGEARDVKRNSDDSDDAITMLHIEGDIRLWLGDLADAESLFRAAANIAFRKSIYAPEVVQRLAKCLMLRGELDAAERVAEELGDRANGRYQSSSWSVRAIATSARGDTRAALDDLVKRLHEAQSKSQDRLVFTYCERIVAVARQAINSRGLPRRSVEEIHAELETAQELFDARAAGSVGPAWYSIKIRTLRASLFALVPRKRLDAIVLDREALDLARGTYPDLAPEIGGRLAENLLVANQPDEALSVIAEVERLAVETGFLKERALLLAIRLRALVQKDEPPSAIAPHIAAFREALAATDSKRITAETLLGLARGLPPTSTPPDPFDLADEAHRLFLAMPMPAQEARCLEVMGDVLVARGRPEEAKIRYRTARARLERYGLGLRLPKINQKIEKLG